MLGTRQKQDQQPCCDFHFCAGGLRHLLTPALLPPHSGPLEVLSSLSEALILWLLELLYTVLQLELSYM